ncbi:hypothetical protein [Vibrio parahaemolyticus]|uniref:hypothetical protein n=1 Tax=Vibrio parahaemolyticus TaxID=670 RepID=UPI00206684E7|nr:hypothetical protein [Vibrio parahaemolyticus]MDF5475570.1 hypothetical protein [Vibrio parahaemolyticus]MDF5486969.1 hypothetical protein [Vibrio parahaemolyticus]MDF5503496.1 hypothetical protein [Vibrio parahaemolyticus]MDF5529567.1 hypothetical protein [Vibrio parahaemolyticus]MDF5545934.1 hypothetical protein [Vibrio parahaemolyticus]
MSIKNWFVRSEPIKNKEQGALAYAHYLQDENHPNHKNRTTVQVLHNQPVQTALNAIDQAYLLDKNNAKAQKGGRPTSSYMQSFVFSVPETTKLTKKQWTGISKALIRELAIRLDIPADTLLKNCSLVLHHQKNPHLNMIVSRGFDGRSFQQQLTRPSTTNLLKRTFNKAMLNCGYSFEDYQPKNKPNKKLKRWQELDYKEKAINKAKKQLEKLIQASQSNDTKNINRQTNRLNKTIDQLSPSDVLEADKQQALDEIRSALGELEETNQKPVLTEENQYKLRR